MSSTTNTNLKEIFNYNIEYSEWLFKNADWAGGYLYAR